MKPVYAVMCPFGALQGEAGDAPAAAARAWDLALSWVDPEAGGELGAGSRGTLDLGAGSTASWSTVSLGDRTVRRLVHALEPSEASPTGWKSVVWVCRDGDRSWAVVRSGPENPAGVVTALRYETGRPRVVGTWLDELPVVRDRRRLSRSALNYGQGDVANLMDLLVDARRQLPIVAISRAVEDGGAQKPLLRPEALAHDLAGNAHVVVVDRQAAWRLTEQLGQQLSVYNGAVRIWWPRFSPEDEPYRHPLLLPERITDDPDRARRHVARVVWRAAVDAVPPPMLESRIAAEVARLSSERRVADLKSKLDEATKSATVDDSFLQEFEAQLQENERLADLLEEQDLLVQELQEALETARAGAEEAGDEDIPEVESVEEAVRRAAAEATNVIYLQSAFDSAHESEYPNPQQALNDLRAVNRVAARWAEGRLGGDFRHGFAEEDVRFQPGIGNLAKGKYRSDYEIEYGGHRCLMGPHLRRGVGAPVAILRIYWYVDEEAKQLVVGHVGRKLRDASNP